jgi:tetratricopeptide (TPR) repeat protein
MIDGSRAESLKAKGNAALSSKRPLDAVAAFTEALTCSPDALRAVLLSNRSLAYLECGDVSNAETDALACLCIDESWFRAHARYAAARESRGDHLGAAKSFSTAAARAGKTVEADSMRSAAARCLGAFETAEKRKAAESMGSPRPTLAQLMNVGRRRVEIAATLKSAPSLWTLAAAHPAIRIARGNEGRGRGLFATRIIRAFEPVLVDTAVMFYPMFADSAGPTIAGLASRPSYLRPGSGRASSEASQTWPADNIDGILLQLAPFSVDAGQQFSAPSDPMSASELYQAASALNALSAVIDEDAPAEYRRVLFIAPVGALVNHSCAPNCSYEGFWDSSRDAPGVRIFCRSRYRRGR